MRYPAEILYVDRDGSQYAAKICGYDLRGAVNPGYTGDRVSADAAGLEGVEVLAQQTDPLTHQVTEERVAIVDCKATSRDGVAYTKEGQIKVTHKTAYLDLLVNVGNGKRGEIWNFIPNVMSQSSNIQGAAAVPKPYWKRLPDAPPAEPIEPDDTGDVDPDEDESEDVDEGEEANEATEQAPAGEAPPAAKSKKKKKAKAAKADAPPAE